MIYLRLSQLDGIISYILEKVFLLSYITSYIAIAGVTRVVNAIPRTATARQNIYIVICPDY